MSRGRSRPCLCVTRDERWGRSYESFGEDPALVTAMAAAAIVGLQGARPDATSPDRTRCSPPPSTGSATAAPTYDPALAGSGYPIDQGITQRRRAWTSSGGCTSTRTCPRSRPASARSCRRTRRSRSRVADRWSGCTRTRALNTDLLKGELGFDGFLISDWEGIDKLPGGTYADKAVRSVNAGLDMAMAPYNFGAFITAITGGGRRRATSRRSGSTTRSGGS